MNRCCQFGYAQARAQARLGRRPADGLWGRLRQSVDAEDALQIARSHKPWAEALAGLAGTSDAHRIEAALEQAFVSEVETAARWAPSEWATAIRRLGQLPGLARDRHAALGESPWDWLRERPGEVETDRQWPLGGAGLLEAWLTNWSRSRPVAAARPELSTLIERVRRAVAELGSRSARLEDLEVDLQRHCRREVARPGALLAYLALAGMDLVRLRGSLVRARLLPETGGAS